MTNEEIAIAFIERFASGDVDGIAPLLADHFHLKGPLFEFDSKQAYLESLAGNLEPAGCRIRSVIGNEDRVLVLYDYEKPDGTLTVAQWFAFERGRIAETLLAF